MIFIYEVRLAPEHYEHVHTQNYFVCFDLFSQFCQSNSKCKEAVLHIYAYL